MPLRLPATIPFKPRRDRDRDRGLPETAAQRLRDLPLPPRPEQTDQSQMAALAARLNDILSGEGGQGGEDEGDHLKRLDMQSELLLRRMAVILRKQAPKVSVEE